MIPLRHGDLVEPGRYEIQPLPARGGRRNHSGERPVQADAGCADSGNDITQNRGTNGSERYYGCAPCFHDRGGIIETVLEEVAGVILPAPRRRFKRVAGRVMQGLISAPPGIERSQLNTGQAFAEKAPDLLYRDGSVGWLCLAKNTYRSCEGCSAAFQLRADKINRNLSGDDPDSACREREDQDDRHDADEDPSHIQAIS